MFASGGELGYALAVQKSFSAARKPFRLYKVRQLWARVTPCDATLPGLRCCVERHPPGPASLSRPSLSLFEPFLFLALPWTVPNLSFIFEVRGSALPPACALRVLPLAFVLRLPRSPSSLPRRAQQPVEILLPLLQKPPKGKVLATTLEYVSVEKLPGPLSHCFLTSLRTAGYT